MTDSIKQPFFSIIMPAYNSRRFIAKSILSVINQTYIYWELIIINDQSTDDTLNEIKKYCNQDKRIKHLSTLHNSGAPGQPRDLGIQHSKGKYICFLDSDDIFEKYKLQMCFDKIIGSMDIDLLHSAWHIMDENGSFLRTYKKPWFYKFYSFFLSFNWVVLLTNPFCLSTMVIKKEIVQKHKFNKNPYVFKAVEDWYNWIRIIHDLNPKIIFIDVPLVKYRWVKNSISARDSHRCEYEAIVAFSYLMKDHIISIPQWLIACLIRFLRIFSVKYLNYKVV